MPKLKFLWILFLCLTTTSLDFLSVDTEYPNKNCYGLLGFLEFRYFQGKININIRVKQFQAMVTLTGVVA